MLERWVIERMSRLVPHISRRRRGTSPGPLIRPPSFSISFRFRPPRADERD